MKGKILILINTVKQVRRSSKDNAVGFEMFRHESQERSIKPGIIRSGFAVVSSSYLGLALGSEINK